MIRTLAPGVAPDWRCRADTALAGVAAILVEGVSPLIDAAIRAARRLLPLRLARQSPALTGHFRQPADIGERILPRDADDRMVRLLLLLHPICLHIAPLKLGWLAHSIGPDGAGVLSNGNRMLAN